MAPLALLLADSRFPSGCYAHSLGLEQAVADGLTDVPAFLAARQRLVAEADARFAVEARRQRAASDALARLEDEWARALPEPAAARRRAPARRAAAAHRRAPSGRRAIEAYRAARRTPRPIALGVVAAAAGLSDEARAAAPLRRRRDRRRRRR